MMEEKSPDLPKGWVWAKLDQVSDIVLGQSPPSATYNDEKIGLPFFQGKKEFGDIYPLVSRWCSEPKKIAEKEDILISVRAPVGPTNICAQRSCIGRGLAAIRSAQYLNHLLLLYYLRMSESKIAKKGTGSTFSAISGRQLRGMNIPLPPLPEQYRIVAKIEELFTNLDAGIESLKKVQVQIKRYRQAVLKQAFEGKLTAGWREMNRERIKPASHLINMITRKRENTINRRKKQRCFPETTTLYQLPDGWEWAKVKDAGSYDKHAIVDGPFGSYLKVSDYIDDGDVPVISISNIDEGFTESNLRFISKDKFEQIKRSQIKPGDILVAKIGSSYGKCGFYPQHMPIGIIPANLLKITVSDDVKKHYVYYYLQSHSFKERLDSITKSSAQPAFNVSMFRELPMPLTDPFEQQKIVEEIEHRFSIADRVEEMVEQNLRRAEHLRQSILKKAFAGKLVPQDPTDEPASVLLERIRVEKEKSASKEKQRKRSKQ